MHSKVTINRPWTTPTTLCMTRTMQHKDQPLLWCVSGVKGYLVMMNFGLITPPKKLKNLLCYDLNITKNLYTYFEKTHCLVLCFLETYYYFIFLGGCRHFYHLFINIDYMPGSWWIYFVSLHQLDCSLQNTNQTSTPKRTKVIFMTKDLNLFMSILFQK